MTNMLTKMEKVNNMQEQMGNASKGGNSKKVKINARDKERTKNVFGGLISRLG